jgi:spermidine synthase
MACGSLGADPAALSAEALDARLVAWDLDGQGYYNGVVHAAQFALPNFLRDLLA